MAIVGYLTGTRITTPGGGIPIEMLFEGELVVTRSGRVVPITGLGKVRFDPMRLSTSPDWRPVRVKKNAFEDGAPSRDLLLAPDQSVIVDGFATPVGWLVNGATILRDQADGPIAYFIVETTDGDVLLAENALVLADSGRAATARPIRDGDNNAEEEPGEALLATHAVLAARAVTQGFSRTSDPALHVIVRGNVVHPFARTETEYSFHIPAGVSTITVNSRMFVPNDMRPGARDERRLGVAIQRIEVRAREFAYEIPLEDAAHSGFHVLQEEGRRRWRWTDGNASLNFPL